MTRPAADVLRVDPLLRQGLSQTAIARITGIPRPTVSMWARSDAQARLAGRTASQHVRHAAGRATCRHIDALPLGPYAYLLGLYLGDGCISAGSKGVYRLRITLDQRYPSIIAESVAAMAEVLPNRVNVTPCPGCVSVGSYSKHWPCVFPQHGSGAKHLRDIVLAPWQERIALELEPKLLLRGLIHSDGYRGMNRVGTRYAYPRYQFSNRSADIRAIFTEACRRIGVVARPMGRWGLSVARRDDVAFLDSFIGPKR